MGQNVLTWYAGELPLHSYVKWERKGSQREAAKAGSGLISRHLYQSGKMRLQELSLDTQLFHWVNVHGNKVEPILLIVYHIL